MIDDSADNDLVLGSEVEFWLGSAPDTYQGLGYDLIVNCSGSWPDPGVRAYSSFRTDCPVMILPIEDSLNEALCPTWEELFNFLDAVHGFLAGKGTDRVGTDRVLFHCQSGINRSAFLLGVYLVRHQGFTPDEAIELIRRKRSDLCLSNTLFEEKLRSLGTKR